MNTSMFQVSNGGVWIPLLSLHRLPQADPFAQVAEIITARPETQPEARSELRPTAGLACWNPDSIVGKSLGLLHSRVAHPWTIADLAVKVGISRSALVERFTRFVSEPPMAYLTRWRLQLAARSLESTSRGVAEIAADVGYESEAAFNRAFKREFGQPPGRYRGERRNLIAQRSSASC